MSTLAIWRHRMNLWLRQILPIIFETIQLRIEEEGYEMPFLYSEKSRDVHYVLPLKKENKIYSLTIIPSTNIESIVNVIKYIISLFKKMNFKLKVNDNSYEILKHTFLTTIDKEKYNIIRLKHFNRLVFAEKVSDRIRFVNFIDKHDLGKAILIYRWQTDINFKKNYAQHLAQSRIEEFAFEIFKNLFGA